MLEIFITLIQHMGLFLIIAYLASKTPIFKPFIEQSTRLPHKILFCIFFSIFCILATELGNRIPLKDQLGETQFISENANSKNNNENIAIANTRDMGAIVGGLLGGPIVGFFIGLVGGIHRYAIGGWTAIPCAFNTLLAGCVAGLFSYYLRRAHRSDLIFSPLVAGGLTFCLQCIGKLVVLFAARPSGDIVLFAPPSEETINLLKEITLPMVFINSFGSAIFISLIVDRKREYDKLASNLSSQALRIAERSVGILTKSMTTKTGEMLAKIIQEETDIGAVVITDTEKIIATIGKGAEHHEPGLKIASEEVECAISQNKVIFINGVEIQYDCPYSNDCPFGSCLIIPLHENQKVVATLLLFENKNKLFLNINRSLGEGIARLLSNQLLNNRYNQQQTLLVQSELKLLQAQVNPHFLFNALNTISAVMRKNGDSARDLLLHLSSFMRKNLKRDSSATSLSEELEQLDSYLVIEKARYGDNLDIVIDIDKSLTACEIPSFTLLPIVENAIKHGTSQSLNKGQIIIGLFQKKECIYLTVEDNAGLYQSTNDSKGLGINIVNKRIQNEYGERYGVDIAYKAKLFTRVTITLPLVRQEHDQYINC